MRDMLSCLLSAALCLLSVSVHICIHSFNSFVFTFIAQSVPEPLWEVCIKVINIEESMASEYYNIQNIKYS